MISIHAPVKGATDNEVAARVKTTISIHAPVKGATIMEYRNANKKGDISIHAPVKGATERFQPRPVSSSNFNPRSREGSDSVPGTAPG